MNPSDLTGAAFFKELFSRPADQEDFALICEEARFLSVMVINEVTPACMKVNIEASCKCSSYYREGSLCKRKKALDDFIFVAQKIAHQNRVKDFLPRKEE